MGKCALVTVDAFEIGSRTQLCFSQGKRQQVTYLMFTKVIIEIYFFIFSYFMIPPIRTHTET